MPSAPERQLFKELMLKCKKVRKAHTALTIRQLSHKLGVTEGFLTALENGRRTPSNKLLMKYFLALGIDTKELIEHVQLPAGKIVDKASKKKRKLLDAIAELDDGEVIASVYEFLQSLLKFKRDQTQG